MLVAQPSLHDNKFQFTPCTQGVSMRASIRIGRRRHLTCALAPRNSTSALSVVTTFHFASYVGFQNCIKLNRIPIKSFVIFSSEPFAVIPFRNTVSQTHDPFHRVSSIAGCPIKILAQEIETVAAASISHTQVVIVPRHLLQSHSTKDGNLTVHS
jgi:hypothetical protein